jgi:hypothetical protein
MHLIQDFMNFLLNMKMYHWKTTSYPRHKASDDCFQKIHELIDEFVEVSIGKYGRNKVFGKVKGSCTILNLTDKSVIPFVNQFKNKLEKIDIKADDLLSIRDEMVAELNQCLYLFTLNGGRTR